jgi:hypothetical protein
MMAKITPAEKAPPASTDFGKKVLAHKPYYNANGMRIPGTTTITGLLAKPALVAWANRMGLDGIDTGKYIHEAGDVGTLAHHIIEQHLRGKAPETDGFSADQIAMASNAARSFFGWIKEHNVAPKLIEDRLISERYQYGGTIDTFGVVDGIDSVLWDYKTSNGVWPEHFMQVSGYWNLLHENGHSVKRAVLLRIGRDGSGLEEHVIEREHALREFDKFLCLLRLYQLQHEKRRVEAA